MSTFQKVFTTNLNFWPSIWCHFESVLFLQSVKLGAIWLCWEGRVDFQFTSISTGYVRNKIRNDRSEQVCLFSVFQCAAPPRCTRWHPPLLFARCLDHQTQWHSALNVSKITSAQRWRRGPLGRQTRASRSTSTPGATIWEETQGFVRFLPSKHRLPFKSLPSSNLYSLHFSTLFTSLLSLDICIKSLHFSTRFTSLLSSCLYSLSVFTSLPSSFLYCLRISTLFTLLLPSHLCPLHISTFFTSLLSSLLYSLSHLYSLHFSTPFTSLFSSHLYSLHFSNVCTSLLSSHFYSLHISTLFTSLVSSHLYCLHIATLFTSHCLHISTLFKPLLSSNLYSLHVSTLFTSLLSAHLYPLHISTVLIMEFRYPNFLWLYIYIYYWLLFFFISISFDMPGVPLSFSSMYSVS